MDDCSFYGETFGERMEGAVRRIFELIETTSEVESKLLLMNLLKILATQAQDQFRRVAKPVMERLLSLWLSFSDVPMIKSSILRVLSEILPLFGVLSDSFSVLFPILLQSTDVSHKDSLYLLDDGLSLWIIMRLSFSFPLSLPFSSSFQSTL